MSRHWKGAPEGEPQLCPECASAYADRWGGPCSFCEWLSTQKKEQPMDILHFGIWVGLAQLLILVLHMKFGHW